MCGIHETRACRIQFRYEGVSRSAAVSSLKCAWGGWEVARIGEAGYVGVACSIHGNADANAGSATAAEEGGVDERGSGGIQLRHEGDGGDDGGLESARSRREVSRTGVSGDEGVS